MAQAYTTIRIALAGAVAVETVELERFRSHGRIYLSCAL